MTTPNQPAPTWMALLGLGAFQIGGTGGGSGLSSYGQGIDESFVNDLIYGPLAPKNLAANSGAVSDLIPVMQQMISGVPIAVLKYLQPFIPGATDADFADSPTAAAFIVGTFIPKLIIETTNGINRLVKDLEILFDVFHVTYPAGAPTDPAGQTSWFAAWNDLLALIGISTGTTPTTPAPTIGPAITGAGTAGANGSSWSTRLTNDLLVLLDVFHLTYTVTQWNAAWTDLLALFGIVNSVTAPTNPTPTIGPAITSAQATANTGVTNAGTAQTTANTGTSWATRLTNDLTILLDVFHVTYTVTQWNSAWADLMSLLGVVNSTSTPTNPVPTIGSSITAAQSTANTGVTNAATAQSTANSGNTNTGTFLGYTRILSDVLHLTYNVGSSSDTPTTLGVGGVGAGKPTWYSAWNGLLVLEGLVKSTTAPTDTAPTTGTVIQANTATANTASTNASIAIANASAASTANQATNDAIVSATTGATVTGTSTTDVTTGLLNIPASNVVGVSVAAAVFGAQGGGNFATASGSSKNVTWSHTIVTGDLGVVVYLAYAATAGSTYSGAVTYGGVSMTKLTSQVSTAQSGNEVVLEAWFLKAPASGTQTVSATVTRLTGTGGLFIVGGESLSYSGSKIGTATPNNGGGSASLSMSASSATGRMVIGGFVVIATSAPTLSAYNKTSRYSAGPTSGISFIVGDAAGAASLTFSTTCASATNEWAGITVEVEN